MVAHLQKRKKQINTFTFSDKHSFRVIYIEYSFLKMESNTITNVMQQQRICVLIPAYNSEKTIEDVVNSVLQFSSDVIVVNDGSTDKTPEILSVFGEKIKFVSYEENKGKGYALKQGFNIAAKSGFRYALTMDADGQHLAEDIALFAQAVAENPDTLIVGARSFNHPNMPEGNVFANKFSNFWFTVQTLHKLPDTQSGFRIYPLAKMKRMRSLTNRYEAELELLVRSAWKGIDIISIPVNVHYPLPEERVSFFRPKQDFSRISVLNTCLCVLMIVYGYPSMFIHQLTKKKK